MTTSPSRPCLHVCKRRMVSHQMKRPSQQRLPRLHPVPRRGSRRVGQGNQIKPCFAIPYPKLLPNALVQPPIRQELFDRQLAHRNHQLWLENLHLFLQPRPTVRNLLTRRHSISARLLFPGKTAAHRRHVNPTPETRLIQPGLLLEPLEERLSCRPRKRPSKHRFLIARSLSHQQNLAHHRSATHHRLVHVRAKRTSAQLLHMERKQFGILGTRRTHGSTALCPALNLFARGQRRRLGNPLLPLPVPRNHDANFDQCLHRQHHKNRAHRIGSDECANDQVRYE